MRQVGAGGPEDFNILYKLIASQFNACDLNNISEKLIPKTDEMPQPSHWLMHLVMVGRDVLGITNFNFHEDPVTPHTSFVNSLQPYYTYPQIDISELESPIKHFILGTDTASMSSYGPPPLEEHHLAPGPSNREEREGPTSCQQETGSCVPDYKGDVSHICEGQDVPPPTGGSNLETVIDDLNSQLDEINTEIRDKINELSTLSPEKDDTISKPPESPNKDEGECEGEGEPDLRELYPEPLRPLEPPEPEPQTSHGLTIEELEPISAPRPKRKHRRNNPQKEELKKRKKSSEKPSCSNADPSKAGETELLSDLQRVLTSDMMSSSSQPKKTRAPRNGASRKNSVPMISLDEQTLIEKMAQDNSNSQSSIQDDPALNSKLLTELQRLLTQNSIRSALQGKKRCARPSLDSPPYIRPPHLHDSTSMDGTRFHLDKPRMFPCLQCNKEFKTKQCLKRHISRHLGVKPHVCSDCHKRFNDKSNLKRHVLSHINLRKFECDVCDQAFYRKEVMEIHKRRKHTIPNDILRCRFKKCGYTCNIPPKLVEHIQTVHFHNYRHNCEKCNYKTQHNMNFIKHLRVHSNDRPYKCPKCGKGFKQRGALKKHSLVHLDRPYKCEICLKTFGLDLALRIHYENNHGPRAAQKKLQEKRKREILRKYRQQRRVHSKKISFVNVMATKL